MNKVMETMADVLGVRTTLRRHWCVAVLLGAFFGGLLAAVDLSAAKQFMDVRLSNGIVVKGVPAATDLREVEVLYSAHLLRVFLAGVQSDSLVAAGAAVATGATATIESSCIALSQWNRCSQQPMVLLLLYPLLLAGLAASVFPVLAEIIIHLTRQLRQLVLVMHLNRFCKVKPQYQLRLCARVGADFCRLKLLSIIG